MAFGQPTQEVNLQVTGAVSTSSRASWVAHIPYRIKLVRSSVGTTPATDTLVLDVQRGAAADPNTLASIFDSGDTKPSIAVDAYVGTSTPPTSVAIVQPGDRLVLVPSGSFSAAANLAVSILLEPV